MANPVGRRAVIVEDNPQMRNLIHMVLGTFGTGEIVEAKDGAEAIVALRSGGADIVIMDWKMEGMDGLECTRRIRAGTDGINPLTPVILLTGSVGRDSEIAAYAAGVDHYMEKPFSLKQLHGALLKVLG